MRRASALLFTAMLAACISQPRTPEPARYDLGAAPDTNLMQAVEAQSPPLRLRVSARSWLDDTSMHYRLMYGDQMQASTYAYARWVAPPAELLAQRLQHRLARGQSAGPSAGLELELEEFVQEFASPTQSVGRVTVHVRLTDGSTRHAVFSEQSAAQTPDAAGGARALAAASDALIARLLDWIGGAHSRMTRDEAPRLANIEEMLEAHWLLTSELSP